MGPDLFFSENYFWPLSFAYKNNVSTVILYSFFFMSLQRIMERTVNIAMEWRRKVVQFSSCCPDFIKLVLDERPQSLLFDYV